MQTKIETSLQEKIALRRQRRAQKHLEKNESDALKEKS